MDQLNKIVFNERFWFPTNTSGRQYGWSDLDNTPGSNVYYPQTHDLHWSLALAVVLIVIRYALDRWVFIPLGHMLGVSVSKRHPPAPNAVLELAFKNNKSLDHHLIEKLAKQTDMTIKQVHIWFRKRKVVGTPSAMQRFIECSWHLLFYTVAFICGACLLWHKPFFWDIRLCWVRWPIQHVPDDIYWYYLIELAFYWSLVFMLFKDSKRKDRTEMIIHHIATIALIYFSWMMNLVRIGTHVLLVHDAADPFLSAGKMANYCKRKRMKEIIFAMFVVVWFMTRLGYYPFRVLWSTSVHPFTYMTDRPCFIYLFLNFFLYVLLVLHFMWTYSIYKVVKNILSKGQVVDMRSDSDSSED